MLMYYRDHHNIVKQLSINKKWIKIKINRSVGIEQELTCNTFFSLFLLVQACWKIRLCLL